MEKSKNNVDAILEVKNLKTYFYLEDVVVRALDGVNLTLPRKTTVGLVGESGCGKSVMSRAIMRLIQTPPGRIVDGEILLHRKSTGETIDIVKLDPLGSEMRDIRGAEIAIVFQEPMMSLNPLYTVGYQIAESVMLHEKVGKRAGMDRALEMLSKVQISAPKQRLNEYPHQLSGGMRQRVMIALAMSCNPSILIADEPTTALDVTVQAQILDLMNQLQEDFGTSIIMITHNLGVVSQMAQEVAVMYLGKIVEYADVNTLFHEPKHPYTIGLLNSVPVLGRKEKNLVPIQGMVPMPTEEIRGCAFAPRCPHAMKICSEQTPVLNDVQSGHQVACWLHEPVPADA
jgi:oligopeptide transport system ATP-binding protein